MTVGIESNPDGERTPINCTAIVTTDCPAKVSRLNKND